MLSQYTLSLKVNKNETLNSGGNIFWRLPLIECRSCPTNANRLQVPGVRGVWDEMWCDAMRWDVTVLSWQLLIGSVSHSCSSAVESWLLMPVIRTFAYAHQSRDQEATGPLEDSGGRKTRLLQHVCVSGSGSAPVHIRLVNMELSAINLTPARPLAPRISGICNALKSLWSPY